MQMDWMVKYSKQHFFNTTLINHIYSICVLIDNAVDFLSTFDHSFYLKSLYKYKNTYMSLKNI